MPHIVHKCVRPCVGVSFVDRMTYEEKPMLSVENTLKLIWILKLKLKFNEINK